MSLETIALLIFVAGISLNVFFEERVIAVLAAISGLVYTLLVIIHNLR